VGPEPVYTRWWRENSQSHPGLEPPIIQPVAIPPSYPGSK